jgi:hypothetical protein
MIYAAHYNYDYEETMFSSFSLEEVMQDVETTFETECQITDPRFGDEVDNIYSMGSWKGFALYAIDPETGKTANISVKNASKACMSNHEMLEFIKQTKKMTRR